MAAALSFPVRSPEWVLTYQGTNITANIAPMVVSITYTDYLSELSGEVEVAIEDHDQKWQAAWFPSLGDQLNVAIGYRGEGLLPCGDFQVDQLELAGPPDTFTMRCLAAFITPAMRTRNSVGFENQTLLGIAQTIGDKYGLAVISTPDVTDIAFERVTQKHETDLGFLKRLAIEHDYDFTVRGSLLVFYSRTSLAAVIPTQALDRTDLTSFEFRNRSHRVYRGAQVTYQNLTTKSLIFQSAASAVPVATADLLK
jgi:phage protein D